MIVLGSECFDFGAILTLEFVSSFWVRSQHVKQRFTFIEALLPAETSSFATAMKHA